MNQKNPMSITNESTKQIEDTARCNNWGRDPKKELLTIFFIKKSKLTKNKE
jgi:hypothetical protein